MGEAKRKALAGKKQSVSLDTFGGRLHVEGDPTAVTPLGQLSFFLDFLKVSGLFDAWVEECPLSCEYAVLVTSTAYPIRSLAQLYRDRADAETNFDELKINGDGVGLRRAI